MKARRTTAAVERPTRAPTLGREDHRGRGCWGLGRQKPEC